MTAAADEGGFAPPRLELPALRKAFAETRFIDYPFCSNQRSNESGKEPDQREKRRWLMSRI
jgi:hypothetical protein